VRYIQLVENEELIGTLLETNERVIAALQMYDVLSKPETTADDVEEARLQMAAVKVNNTGELDRLQEKQRAAVERSINRNRERERETYASPPPSAGVHPDLQDLSFGTLGSNQGNLPPPLQPSGAGSEEEVSFGTRGSLSDYSDYDSSDEETHNQRSAAASSSRQAQASASTAFGTKPARRHYVNVSDEEVGARQEEDDPFADPFAG